MITDYYQKKPTDDPGAVKPLTISGISVTGIMTGHATVIWTTSQPSSSQVRYGILPPDGWQDNITPETNTSPLVTVHSVILVNLLSGQNYWFQVRSRLGGGKDGGNNAVMDGYVFTAYGTFTT